MDAVTLTVTFLVDQRKSRSTTLVDVCFCRVDSLMLLEEGFRVTSTDASDKMLKYAMKERWNRRKQPAYDNWGTNHLTI